MRLLRQRRRKAVAAYAAAVCGSSLHPPLLRCHPLPSLNPRPPSPAAAAPTEDAHPRALRLTERERGCLIKYKVTPVRSDGDVGHGEASRPTAEIA